MAQVIIQFPDEVGGRTNNLLARRWRYQETIPDPDNLPNGTLPNPESKVDFNKRAIVEMVKREAVDQEVVEAGRAAEVTQRAISETELDLTPG